MRRLTSVLMPPLFQAVYSQWRSHGTLRYLGKTYTGIFRTFDEVRRGFPEAVPYNSPQSEREEIARLEATKATLLKSQRGEAPPANERYRLLALLVSASHEPAPHILDIGGGTGDALPYLVYCCPGKSPRLSVCELPPIVQAAKRVFADLPSLRFVEGIEAVNGPVEIAFFGSSLQYFEDYRTALKQVAALTRRVIVIADSPMTDAPTFVPAQVNMRRRVIPDKVINRAELTDYVSGLGFRLIHRSRTAAAAHFRNFPPPQSASALSSLIFVNRQNST